MTAPQPAIAIADHQPFDPEPLRAKRGERLQLVRRDENNPDFAGWWWCTNATGKGGFVPDTFMTIDGNVATLTRDYDATELEVKAGDTLDVVEEHNGWLWVRAASGQGWVPKRNVLLT